MVSIIKFLVVCRNKLRLKGEKVMDLREFWISFKDDLKPVFIGVIVGILAAIVLN